MVVAMMMGISRWVLVDMYEVVVSDLFGTFLDFFDHRRLEILDCARLRLISSSYHFR